MNAFSWCEMGQHDQCRRSYEPMFWDEGRKAFVSRGYIKKCECSKRGCECYVPKKEQTKKKTRKRKS